MNRLSYGYNDKKSNFFTGELRRKYVEFENLLPNIVLLANDLDRREYIEEYRSITNFLHATNIVLQKCFQKIKYMGPLRVEPSRRYIYEDDINSIGIKGENAPYFFYYDRDKRIKDHYFYDVAKDRFYIKEECCMKEAITNWLELMEIKNFDVNYNNDVLKIMLNTYADDNVKVNIADVGFGVSQIFPIILEGLRMPKGGRILLEQPEIHLHPALQMKLADYFIALAKSGKNFVIETHSDHIVNRLVRRIVEDESSTLRDLVKIYFVEPGLEGSSLNEVTVDDESGIVNWPTGFFDQTATEQELIIRAGLKKRKMRRNKKDNKGE